MTIEILHKWQRFMLLGLIVTLPLTTIPKVFQIPGLGPSFSDYFFIIGFCLIIYEFVKYGFTIDKKIKKFLLYIFYGKLFVSYMVYILINLMNY